MSNGEIKAVTLCKTALLAQKDENGKQARTNTEVDCILSVLTSAINERDSMRERAEIAERRLGKITATLKELTKETKQ